MSMVKVAGGLGLKTWLAGLLLVCHVVVVVNLAWQWAPTPDEFAHIAGGLLIWESGRYDLYTVNPPLTRMVAAFPAFMMKPVRGWAGFDYKVEDRPEFQMGRELMASHPKSFNFILVSGRLTLFAFGLFGAVLCSLWAKELFGSNAGLTALALWCFSPNFVTWSAVIGPDLLAASFGVSAGYAFYRWSRKPTWGRAGIAGVALGLAQLAKLSWLILFPLWILLTAIACLHSAESCKRPRKSPRIAQLVMIMSLGVYVINAGYAFVGVLPRLDSIQFFSTTLAGQNPVVNGKKAGGNRFRGSWLGAVRLPVPVDYIRGIDLQKWDFEKGRPSYLIGKWNGHGWWYYYLVGLTLKTPVGTIGLVVMGMICSIIRCDGGKCFSQRYACMQNLGSLKDQVIVLAPAVALLVLVSACSGFSCHYRYVLPAFPFVFVWMSRVSAFRWSKSSWRSAAVVSLLSATACESAITYPHTMSFFNSIAGGASCAPDWMLSSSFYWGQDMYYLKRWLKRHAPNEVPFVTLSMQIPPEHFNIPSRGQCPRCEPNSIDQVEPSVGPVPGLHVIDIEAIRTPNSGYYFYEWLKPIAKVGYALRVYRVSASEANRIRDLAGFNRGQPCEQSSGELVDRLTTRAEITRPPRVGLYVPQGVNHDGPEMGYLAACVEGMNWECIDDSGISHEDLTRFDVIIFPGGRASVMSSTLGVDGKQRVQKFVEQGGGYVGICGGAFLGSTTFDWGLNLANVRSQTDSAYVPRLGQKLWHDRGAGTVRVALTPAGRAVLGENLLEFEADFSSGPVFLPGSQTFGCECVPLARYKTEMCRYAFQEGSMLDTPAIVASQYGDGAVVLIGSHLETRANSTSIVAKLINAVSRHRVQPSRQGPPFPAAPDAERSSD